MAVPVLLQDVEAGELHHLGGHVRVADPAFSGLDVLLADLQARDRALQAILLGPKDRR